MPTWRPPAPGMVKDSVFVTVVAGWRVTQAAALRSNIAKDSNAAKCEKNFISRKVVPKKLAVITYHLLRAVAVLRS